MFKNLATIVEVFGDLCCLLIGLRPMYNHHMMVAAGRTWSQTIFGAQDCAFITD